MVIKKIWQTSIVILLTSMLSNCGSSHDHKHHDHKHHDHDHNHNHKKQQNKPGAHTHVAPNGGVLVEIGDEFAHLELVVDSANSKIICYVFDGALKFGLKAKQATIEAEINETKESPDEKKVIVFKAISNLIANNTEEESSQYEAEYKMKPNTKISLRFKNITINNKSFENVTSPLIEQK